MHLRTYAPSGGRHELEGMKSILNRPALGSGRRYVDIDSSFLFNIAWDRYARPLSIIRP